jgi:NitT/TauT family transport system ATP-binding protein
MSTGLRIEGLHFSWAGAPALRNIDLEVREGEFLSLLGPSGSGKSTLLRLLAGLEQPDAGRISWDGKIVSGPSIERGVVFQDYSLYPWLSLVDNIAFAVGKAHSSLSKAQRHQRARDFLVQVGLEGAIGKFPFELSGGMKQRGALARALALGSRVLLLDEPFGALDPVNRARLQDLLLATWQATEPRKTIVFVTHDIDEALYLGDRIAVLGASPGHLIANRTLSLPRPRERKLLFASQAFHQLREEIAEVLSADTLNLLTVN